MGTTPAGTFAEKFEEALEELRDREPGYGLRTLARKLAKDDPARIETIRRRLNKYRPKPGGGAAETAPTEPTRREIEDAMGLPPDTLKPDPVEDIAAYAEGVPDEPEMDELTHDLQRAVRAIVRDEIRNLA